MKTLSVSFFFLFSIAASAQEVQKYYNYNWQECDASQARFCSFIKKTDSGFYRQDYFIREKKLQMSGRYKDSQCKMRDGYFKYYHSNGSIKSIGLYIDNKKEGLWKHYSRTGITTDSSVFLNGRTIGTSLSWHTNGQLKDSVVRDQQGTAAYWSWFENGSYSSIGSYITNNKRGGKWTFFHNNGQVSSIENYENNVLIDKTYFDETGNPKNDSTNNDRDAAFPKGEKGWSNYIQKKIYFPEGATFINGDEAVVVVRFSIDEAGKVGDVEIEAPFHPKFDSIAKKAIEESPDWIPSISHNRYVKFWVRFPMTFVQ